MGRSTIYAFFLLLFFSIYSHAQIIDEIWKAPADKERYYAATIEANGKPNVKIYPGTYYFHDIAGKNGFLGIWGNVFGITYSAVNLSARRGYQIKVCGTFAGTKRYLCLPFFEGNNSLKVFSDVDRIEVTKMRVKDEIVMWHGNGAYRIAIPAPMNLPPGGRYFNSPSALWVPNGYWVRLCTTEQPSAKTCKIYTADASNLKAGNDYIKVGKGLPPKYPQVIIDRPTPRPRPLPSPRPRP